MPAAASAHVAAESKTAPLAHNPGPPSDAAPQGSAEELREVKVKLPVDQVLRLHYARMTQRQNFSEIVSSALSRYFREFSQP